jgi:hypothetical protein
MGERIGRIMNLSNQIRQQLLLQLETAATDENAQLNEAFRLLSKWRSVLLQNTLLQQEGTKVLQGPLAGLDFIENSAEGCHIAKLLGCYEQPLLPYIQQAIDTPYQQVVNIGCAEGYYAVGMALKMTNTHIKAYDLNPAAQLACQQLAKKNNVFDRINIGSLFSTEDFQKLPQSKTLILCDIEGGERELLDPQLAPALEQMDIIVESHEVLIPEITPLLINRFKESHQITLVEDNGQRHLDKMPAWFQRLAHLDQLIAVWEWRSGPTPWLVMKAQ